MRQLKSWISDKQEITAAIINYFLKLMQTLKIKVNNCRKCSLSATRVNPVFGEGSFLAKVMFIGEAPGANEDATGKPFCGKAGKVLDELLLVAGLDREKIFIGNILKCRPPNNRNPQNAEIDACTPYLDYQINFIKPTILCCLGNFATGYIMTKFNIKSKIQGISKIHGQTFIAEAAYGKIRIIPLFHPAVVTYDLRKKATLVCDFQQLKYVPK